MARAAATALAIIGLLSSPLTQAAGSSAAIDWGSFTAVAAKSGFSFVLDDASFDTTVNAFGGGAPAYDSSADWSTTLAAIDGPASATATAATLSAAVAAVPASGSPSFSADVSRNADFVLSPFNQVTFTIHATAKTDLAANPANSVIASLSAIGGDASYASKALSLAGNGATQSLSGPLSITVVNSTSRAINGYLSAEGTVTAVAAVPEPASSALMLAGLIAVLGIAARRRAS